jgi:hypothetical protein
VVSKISVKIAKAKRASSHCAHQNPKSLKSSNIDCITNVAAIDEALEALQLQRCPNCTKAAKYLSVNYITLLGRGPTSVKKAQEDPEKLTEACS